MGEKDGKNMNISQMEFIVMIEHGAVAGISKGYAYHPKVNFGGGTIKWFDDNKLLKNKIE